MYYSQWGLAETPFRAGTASQAFFPSPTHEEALARLQFLVDQHHRFGLLVGERGTGKSLLLSVLADECRQARVDVANLNLTAICPSEFPQLLAAQLTCVSLCSLNPQQAWQALSDRLAENHYEQRSTLVTLDDAHHADQAVLDQVLRLIHSDRSAGSQLTVVFAIDAGASEKIPADCHELATLRIELQSWHIEDTTCFLANRIDVAGGAKPLFDEQAIARIHDAAAGNPQRIVQLADLALLVGAGDGAANIDPDIVSKAAEELSLAGRS